ncbi:hypothetical protein [Paenibacillus spongiae]|uniref:Alpha-amylase n=1 Tax=Paenibacillus spongiae TaxID=2909671 RepID=A0ABY5SKN4_9BACL|nr:hypothetical protein [Paenibacillus spongiae]UVI33075.1 hypothetical protein L1F29_15080 [Paenibacillus spongiae]
MSDSRYEKWIWIELIGFENKASDDYGVEAYLNTVGYVPDTVSLLLFTPDFVHAHPGMSEEHVLPPEVCSYNARPYGKHRNRQQWTNYQLKGLIGQLQKHGIAVYCAFFDMFHVHNPNELRPSEWCGAHPELYEMRMSGHAYGVINPLKRFKDGSYYEDLFIHDLMTVMRDYHFDGYHGADGYTSSRLSIAEIDYSDDMVEQFVRFSGDELGQEIVMNCDHDAHAVKQRGEWIWHYRRMDWIHFHAARWAGFWEKIMTAIRKEGKKAVANTTWTRDPFEALYRYGVDYKLLAATGIDGFVVESVAASLSAGADGMEYEPITEFMAMLATIKAYVPDVKLICLNAIQDTNEQWDTISHAPTVLERDIYAFSNLYIQEGGELKRSSAGFMACLGDGISRDGWKWLSDRWELGFSGNPERAIGASLVWSDAALQTTLDEFIVNRSWPVHRFMEQWLQRGAPLHTMVNIEDLDRAQGTIVVANLHLLPDNELALAAAYRNGPSILIGKMTERLARIAVAVGLNFPCEPDHYFCMTRDANGTLIDSFVMELEDTSVQQQSDKINDAISWVKALYFKPMNDDFLLRCVETMKAASGVPVVIKNSEFIRISVLEMNPGSWRILIHNLYYNYKSARIDAGRNISSIRVLTGFPGVPVFPEGSQFSLYVPGRGMVIVELKV